MLVSVIIPMHNEKAFVQPHFAYGAGSLWGVLTAPFKFGFRRNRRINKTLR
jgi:hypothetical protein